MGNFLRDEYIRNVTFDEDALQVVSEYFLERASQLNATQPPESKDHVFVTYIIRFDNKGYRFTSFGDVRKFYLQAKEVERLIVSLESAESLRSNRLFGTYLELRLDSRDMNNCVLVASGDDRNWVESVFSGVTELIQKQTNKNRFIRNAWTHFLVQIVGVSLGFVLSLWAGIKAAPHLAFENAFVVSFLFAFLVFSNVWTYLNERIHFVLNRYFPNLRFSRKGKDTLHWLLQTIVGGVVLALTIFLLDQTFSSVGRIVGGFVAK